ncbi:MAG: Glucoamylase GlaM [uncultured bacterium]|nr:MAG: Glucoamylase GlaM [uncultured bacterium]
MQKNKIIYFIFVIIFSVNGAFAKGVPFGNDAVNDIKKYLFANIASESHSMQKNDNGRIIYSLPGAVIASPSRYGTGFSQDYQFHWTRDAALTMQEVVYLYIHADANEKKNLKNYLMNYINFEAKAQQQISRVGEKTLGQPKFNIDGSIWEGEWARPQNDGPALRAQTMIEIANVFLQEGEEKYVLEKMLSIIITDLDYVAEEWKNTNYDLWEEVNDQDHFFTKMVQRKALIIGTTLLQKLGDNRRAHFYLSNATQLTTSMQTHWNVSRGYLSETINQQFYKGGGLDSSILLGVLYGNLNDPSDPFAITNEQVMSSIFYLRNAFSGLYRINIINHHLPLIGRYASDIYDGNQFSYGNPWILITNALAEYYYECAKSFLIQKEINITSNNILFFQQISPDLVQKEEVVRLSNNPEKFHAIRQAFIQEGDHFLEAVKQYATCYDVGNCNHFSEQIDRASGQQVSAKDLTWGYATLLAAVQARSDVN